MEKITVTVTKKHLETALVKGVKNSITETCLIAQAIKAGFPKRARVSVSYSTASVYIGKNLQTFCLPSKATRLIQRFDKVAGEKEADLTKPELKALAKLRVSLPVSFVMVEEE